MATTSADRQLQQLRSENKRLQRENAGLKKALAAQAEALAPTAAKPKDRHFFKNIGVLICVAIAAALLLAGNVLFWAGNTVVKPDRYVEATAPLIRDPAIQDALADKLTQQVTQDVDIEQLAADALPPRAQFLAPTLADQFERYAGRAIHDIIAKPRFQEVWNNVNQRSHQRFIKVVEANGSDGSIDISEFYAEVSQQLKGTRLAFLADKPLPARVGEVELAQGTWLTVLQRTIQNIDLWRTITILLIIGFSALAIWLSRNRRQTTIILGALFALMMFISLVAIRLGREALASQVDSQYSEAARQAYAIFLNPLRVQTLTILCLSLLIVLVAWISGQSASSRVVRQKIDQLFSGKLHAAIFSTENGFTRWVGRYKRVLQWLVVAIVAVTILFTRVTPSLLAWDAIIVLVLVLVIEVLAAKQPD